MQVNTDKLFSMNDEEKKMFPHLTQFYKLAKEAIEVEPDDQFGLMYWFEAQKAELDYIASNRNALNIELHAYFAFEFQRRFGEKTPKSLTSPKEAYPGNVIEAAESLKRRGFGGTNGDIRTVLDFILRNEEV